MDDARLGTAFRALRIRRGWRQADVAPAAGVSRSAVSRLERGNVDALTIEAIRRIAAVFDGRVELIPRWQGGDLGRLLNERHGAMHEAMAGQFVLLPDWIPEPEVSFAIYGERGIIDILCWHPGRRMLLVIELKTELVDVNELMGGVDRKRRLAAEIARSRGWDPVAVSVWVVLADSRTNRRHVARHQAVLRSKFPVDGRSVPSWLRDPSSPISALSFLPSAPGGAQTPGYATVRRVRRCRGAGGGS
jgi:transcriptional regulator with XRE-family HTH domain